MTSKLDPQELERLSKAAEQEDDDVRYYGGPTSTHRPARDAYHAALVQLHRTGQLVPAMPSGDVVEAVARALYEEDDPWCKAWPWPNLQPDQGSPDAYRRLATAAITTYEAVSGVAKMREALEPAFVTSETEGGLSTDKVQYKLVFKFRSLAELDAAHSAWIYRKGDGRCVD